MEGRCLFRFHLLFVNSHSQHLFRCGRWSSFFQLKPQTMILCPGLVIFYQKIYGKKTKFPISSHSCSCILMDVIHWLSYRLLFTCNFPFSQFFFSLGHLLIFPVSPNTSFNTPILTLNVGTLSCDFFFFASVSKATKAHLFSSHDSRRLWVPWKTADIFASPLQEY